MSHVVWTAMFTEGAAYPLPLTTLKMSHMNHSKVHYVVTNPKTRMIPKWLMLSQTAWYRTATATTVCNTNIFHIINILKKVIELKTPVLRNKLCWRKQLRCGCRILSGGEGEGQFMRPKDADLASRVTRVNPEIICLRKVSFKMLYLKQLCTLIIGLCNHACLYCCCHLFNIIIKYERNNTWLKR